MKDWFAEIKKFLERSEDEKISPSSRGTIGEAKV